MSLPGDCLQSGLGQRIQLSEDAIECVKQMESLCDSVPMPSRERLRFFVELKELEGELREAREKLLQLQEIAGVGPVAESLRHAAAEWGRHVKTAVNPAERTDRRMQAAARLIEGVRRIRRELLPPDLDF